ncbi:MAG TPA: efflux transporter outer membrane subunit [Opitutaceae bacterium]|jgi:NodT family efflux transporter outer membrane factor (OMF) lipoprotein
MNVPSLRSTIRLSSLCGLAALAGCAVGPNYQRPSAPTPPAFKELSGWTQAAPDDRANRGAWWEAFNDADLTGLEIQVDGANQTLAEAAANYQAARQLARSEVAGFFPTVSLDGSGTRSKARSGSTGLTTTGAGGSTTFVPTSSGIVNEFSASGAIGWSPDIFGKQRRQVEEDIDSAQSSAALLASTRLSLHAELATDYIQLRELDARKALLDDSMDHYQRTLTITQNKYKVGVSARSDVITAQTQLDSTHAAAIDTGIQRAQMEHAIAVLIGKAPAELTLAPRKNLGIAVPVVPVALPSQLLERRPDVAEAERAAAAANARIGVQVAAYYPDFTLTAEGGFQGSSLTHLFTLPNRFWTLGASAGETLIDFGARRALVKQAEAEYDSTAAAYRLAVLTAFQQVEDGLSDVRTLEQEHTVQKNAVDEAAQASRIAENEYRAGTVDFTTVVTAEAIELTNRETLLSLEQERLTDTVTLIQALGGGWTTSALPTSSDVRRR